MPKGNGRPAPNRGVNARVANSGNNGRPKPMTPKAGYTQSRRRYGEGGRIK